MYLSESLFGVGLLGESFGGCIAEAQQHKQYSYSLHFLGKKPQSTEQLFALFIAPRSLLLQDKSVQSYWSFGVFLKVIYL